MFQHQEILDNSMLPALWKQFEDSPFLFQHDFDFDKARFIKTWNRKSAVEELDLEFRSLTAKPCGQPSVKSSNIRLNPVD